MKRGNDINKIKFSYEAIFDYSVVVNLEIEPYEIKKELEEYIDNLISANRFQGYYHRVKYFDERSEKMLMLFIYKGIKLHNIQSWEVVGICKASDWDEEIEECGQIRFWLTTRINDLHQNDWVEKYRVWEEEQEKFKLLEEEKNEKRKRN